MIPSMTGPSTWPDDNDEDGWQDMPVIRSDDNPFGLDEEEQKRFHYRAPDRLDPSDVTSTTGNATGAHLELDADTVTTDSWRQKQTLDESDYTRLRLDEDEESEEVHMRTKYLFDEDKAMTPLSQMQATKELLTEGQRIAYVGLCQLIARRMLRDAGRGWEGTKAKGGMMGMAKAKGKGKAEVPVVESATLWMLKMMARLYQHMELERDEQCMIESLGEHGVEPSDLVPALMTTHTVKNPEYDPVARERKEAGEQEGAIRDEEDLDNQGDNPPAYELIRSSNEVSNLTGEATASYAEVGLPAQAKPSLPRMNRKASNPFGDNDEDTANRPPLSSSSSSRSASSLTHAYPSRSSFFDEEDDGDIGRAVSPSVSKPDLTEATLASDSRSTGSTNPVTPAALHDPEKTPTVSYPHVMTEPFEKSHTELPEELTEPAPLPSLPGVSTKMSNTDETITLDIRWTVLCDLFLVLIADSVYDARSRVFLERVAEGLGFSWLDAVRFENRVTDALEIQEGAEKTEQNSIIEARRKGIQKKRYAMMGLAAVGGGLVIGLSAGLLAPVIGAGLGAAFATVGITGTTSFLAGAGGAAMITTGGVLTGANIAGKGMARRTREVRTFGFRPLHNNKRVSCYITVGGFMASMVDDVRLPFSVLDPIIGDVFSVMWEPEMMSEMGSALKILTSEILTQVGQQVLQATVMTALMSALQWPIILTKLGYLIDNPWSNALDRSYAAGLVLADTLIARHAGVRPISLIGFSLGARAIFYALAELARVKAYGIVQDVFLFGATVTASKQTWLEVRSAVSGRFVNGYATNDWMLGYLFRATSGGINTVAGLRPVEVTPGLENVDVTEIITGHMSYRSCMPLLLSLVGFPVTADHFDEPDDPEIDMSVQERTIVNEEEEEVKRNRKRILGLFPRGKGSRTASGTTTPNPAARPSANRSSCQLNDDDDDELPPREVEDLGLSPSAELSSESVASGVEDDEVRAIPKTAGFDFKAISKELGKDIDVDKLRPFSRRPVEIITSTLPPERTGSAPPVRIQVDAPAKEEGRIRIARSVSYIDTSTDDGVAEKEEGDTPSRITGSTPTINIPSWDRSSTLSITSPPLTAPFKPPSSASFNAWSPSTHSTFPPRAAPPARPHPPELMANPFGNGLTSNGILGGWEQTEKELADRNPW